MPRPKRSPRTARSCLAALLCAASAPAAAGELVVVSGGFAVTGGERVCFDITPDGADTARLLVRVRFGGRVPAGRFLVDGAPGPWWTDVSETAGFRIRPPGTHALVLDLEEPAFVEDLVLEIVGAAISQAPCDSYELDQERRGTVEREAPRRVNRLGTPEVGAAGEEPDAERRHDAPSWAGGTLGTGTELALTLETTLSTTTAYPGQRFSALLWEPVPAQEPVLPAGTRVEGHVAERRHAGRFGRSRLTVAFDRVVLPDGRELPLSASLRHVGPGSGRRHGAVIAGAAAAGALLGQVLGGDTEGTLLGAAIGGGVAAGTIAARPGEPVTLPAGTVVVVTLTAPTMVPAR